MIAVILAAGMARRLRPLTDHCPKCLLEVGGRTLLGRTVDAIHAAGISRIVIVTGYRADMIRSYIAGHYPGGDFSFIDNPDYDTTNNIYSLWLARQHADGREFLLLDSDILLDPRLVERVAATSVTSLAVNAHELGDEEMKVITDASGHVVEISKTCSTARAMGESVGVEHIMPQYSTELYRELEAMTQGEGLCDVFYELAFERLIPRGLTFLAIDTTDLMSMELDTPDDFRAANDMAAARA